MSSSIIPGSPHRSASKKSKIALSEVLSKIVELHTAGQKMIEIAGCTGSLPTVVASQLSQRLPGLRNPLLIITRDEDEAVSVYHELQFLLSSSSSTTELALKQVFHFPEHDTEPWQETLGDTDTLSQRMSALFRLSSSPSRSICVISANALARKVPPMSAFSTLTDVFQTQQELDRDQTITSLIQAGYSRMPVCEDPGTFSARGGLIDIFVPLYPYPVRIELYGDLVESIRFYDPETQRTLRALSEIYIHPVTESLLHDAELLKKRIFDLADTLDYPSIQARELLEQLEQRHDFLGAHTLVPAFYERLVPLWHYLSGEVACVFTEPLSFEITLDQILSRADSMYEARVLDKKMAFPLEEFYCTKQEWAQFLSKSTCISFSTEPSDVENYHLPTTVRMIPQATAQFFVESEGHTTLSQLLAHRRLQQHEHLLTPWVDRLQENRQTRRRSMIVVPNLQHGERLAGLLATYQVPYHLHRHGLQNLVIAQQTGEKIKEFNILEYFPPDTVQIHIGSFDRGFDLPLDDLSVYSEAELFGEKTNYVKPKRKVARLDFKDLQPGSFVVHQLHGIGQYQGLKPLPLPGGAIVEFMHLTYQDGALYLPIWRLNEVQRYAGAEGVSPKLDKLGGETWKRAQQKVTAEIEKLAEELLKLYAQRQAIPGLSFKLDDEGSQLFAEFEATFPYEETPDQQAAIYDVLADLDQERPMDRLICGDVGYGKTEVAIRAAVKAVLAGKQVAVLAPTTVLAEQHVSRFAERVKHLPIRVRGLSRFRSKSEQTDTIKQLATGEIDIVVGTHRLLSADVRFKDLGLLVIDEEQRFGVVHKERLKTLKTHLDTLTLSATPIPRTLNMAMSGLREISIISTPPNDRLAVRTIVAKATDELIKEAIRLEIKRGGQVFFVHNRVETIGKWHHKLSELLPEAKILMGHGQMTSDELEKVMVQFVSGKADVLVATTIIESGLDISKANTMLIDRADTFGLSQLYQLRGRVGRSKDRAFCYLLVPELMSDEATKRVMALQRFTQLGSGFNIASYDLELRGAGDLLGNKQAGMISAVGFDLYTQMLQEAIAALKGQPIAHEKDIELTCDLPGFIPSEYIPDTGQRLAFYQRFSTARDAEELEALSRELQDRYGEAPDEVNLLTKITLVKQLAKMLAALSLDLSQHRMTLLFGEHAKLTTEAVTRLITKKNSPWRLTKDMRLSRIFSPEEQNDPVASAERILTELLQG